MITIEQLAPLCARPDAWVDYLNESMGRFEITTNQRIAMFLATCAHESARFATLEENLNYSAKGLIDTWPSRFTPQDATDYARHPSRIAARVYANRGGNGDEASGDGWTYRGRGPIQITLMDNYRRCGDALGLPLLAEPDRLLEPQGGALSAGWFWSENGCNAVADEGDFNGVSGIVNRGNRHKAAANLDDRREWLRRAQAVLG